MLLAFFLVTMAAPSPVDTGMSVFSCLLNAVCQSVSQMSGCLPITLCKLMIDKITDSQCQSRIYLSIFSICSSNFLKITSIKEYLISFICLVIATASAIFPQDFGI